MIKASPSSFDIYCFHEGTNYNSYEFLGCHIKAIDNVKGADFSLWAPHAEKINVVGSFNEWSGEMHPMKKITDSGIWSIFIPGVIEGDSYMYQVYGSNGSLPVLKADPLLLFSA